MTTAYKAYKDRLEKVKQPRNNSKSRIQNSKLLGAAPQNFIDLMEKTIERIGALDVTQWVEEDQISLRMALDRLKKQIDAFMKIS